MLPAHGGFKNLRTFQIARRIYDGTVIFCDRFIGKRSRTHEQMVQAARSGTQNISFCAPQQMDAEIPAAG